MPTAQVAAWPLVCECQPYAWGRDHNGLAARLSSLNTGTPVPEGGTYAELWVGTHVNGPSRLVETGEPLSQVLGATALGRASMGRTPQFSALTSGDGSSTTAATTATTEPDTDPTALPFLLKVLSVGRALSLQLHPSQEQAKVLHAARPTIYKDANHKPEAAIVLEKFEGLSSFRPVHELVQMASHLAPVLRTCVGTANASVVDAIAALVGSEAAKKHVGSTVRYQDAAFRALLAPLFEAVMRAPVDQVRAAVDQLLTPGTAEAPAPLVTLATAQGDYFTTLPELVNRLHTQYPHDVGVIGAIFLNHVHLHAGDALFLAAGEPHAYLGGDFVEVMACSDNVVRAGLTGKYRDVDTLCDLLAYSFGPPVTLESVPYNAGEEGGGGAGEAAASAVATPGLTARLIAPPIADFSTVLFQGAGDVGATKYVPASEWPTLWLCTSGSVTAEVGATTTITSADSDAATLKASWSAGTAFFVGAGNSVQLTADVAFVAVRVTVNEQHASLQA